MVAQTTTVAARGLAGGRLEWVTRWLLAADLLLPLGLVLVGLMVRLPGLWTIPSLTDEANEVLRGLEIARGRLLPATNVATYLSAFFNYLLAAAFWLAGPLPSVPRVVVLLTGVLTVPATYLLARDLASWAGRRSGRSTAWSARVAGTVAAALLAANGAHVLVNSHVAWSHATTPLFATLGLWLLHRAVSRQQLGVLMWSAVVLGVTIHSHTTALALLPGALAYALVRRPSWLREPRAWLAALVPLALSANMIAYNLLTGGESIARARVAAEAYTRGAAWGPDLYLANIAKLGLSLLRLLGGAVDVRADAAAYIFDPLCWLAVVLAATGAGILAIRHGDPLLLCVTVPYVIFFMYFDAKYHVIPNARYLTPLLPLLFASIGVALAELTVLGRGPLRVLAGTVAGGLALLLIGAALWSLQLRTEQLAPSRFASAAVLEAVATLQAHRHADEPVALDPDLDKLWLDGGGDYHMALRYHLAFLNIPTSDLETRPRREQGAIDSCDSGRLELRHTHPSQTPSAPRLVSDDPSTPADESLTPYWLFRTVQPRDRARDSQRGQAEEWSAIVAAYRPPLGASARAVDRCAPGLQI